LPQIDHWVFTRVCEWLEAHPGCLKAVAKVAINISGQSLDDASFRNALLECLRRTSVPLTKLCFEITESEAISNVQSAVKFFEQLRSSGASVSLDDFGTGLSSFEYLKHFHVDYLKIDGMFVRSLERGSHDYVIIKAIQSVAAAMQIETVAEYVENEGIVACLRELGVHYAQGYAIGKPQSLSDMFPLSERVATTPIAAAGRA
jgi:EAL domain-containing protein (putative c-di-GMP-specific phosphodiesterase class I)